MNCEHKVTRELSSSVFALESLVITCHECGCSSQDVRTLAEDSGYVAVAEAICCEVCQ
jgi:hypothetical protein